MSKNRRLIAFVFLYLSSNSSIYISLYIYIFVRSNTPIGRTPFQVSLRCLRCLSTWTELNGTTKKVSKKSINKRLRSIRI
jgi:hypothetical protein